ncbi:MAG TPA: lipopolysaccharide biosynthesis protein [Gaiellaceae bacterium]|nr:lipopolysaccharide biosynthesis protein [Gaiellaceae bacterium]
MSRLLVRRSATAVGIYASVAIGFLSTVVASRVFHSKQAFGDFTTVVYATSFFQSFFDLTVEESLVKYGFRFTTREEWGLLRGLFRSAFWFKLAGSILGGIALVVFAVFAPARMTDALLIASLIPLGQSLEGLAGSALYLRGRYDVRAGFLAWSMTLRLVGVAIGARYGLTAAVAAVLIAQLVSTASVGIVGWIAFHRFPRALAAPLGAMRREVVSFIAQSSAATGVLALRGGLAPLILGGVTSTTQTGIFKIAQAPQSGFQALSAPARMVLLTEQTREWEHGRQAAVLRQVRRYSASAAVLCLIAVPPLWWLMPHLITLVYTSRYAAATGPARLFLLTAAVQLVVGWTKSFPVTIGRPRLRIWTHGLETLVVLPLVVVLGKEWGATGAAGAFLAGMVVFAIAWAAIFVRIRPEDVHQPADLGAMTAEEESEAGVLVR